MSIAILNSYRNDINMYQIMVAKLVSGILAMGNNLPVYYNVLQAVSTDPDVRRAILKGISEEAVNTLLSVETSEDAYKVKCANNNGLYSEIRTLQHCKSFLDTQIKKCGDSIGQAESMADTGFLRNAEGHLGGVSEHLDELLTLCTTVNNIRSNKKSAIGVLTNLVSAWLPLTDFIFHTVESELYNDSSCKPLWEKTLKEYLDELKETMFITYDGLIYFDENLSDSPLLEYGLAQLDRKKRTAYELFTSIMIFYDYMFEESKAYIDALKPAASDRVLRSRPGGVP